MAISSNSDIIMLRVCSVTTYEQTKSVTKQNGKSQQEHVLNSVKLNSEVTTENRT